MRTLRPRAAAGLLSLAVNNEHVPEHVPTGVHPRPQLTRPRWYDLSGAWQFAYDDGDVGLEQKWQERADVFDRTITVPYPPESPASGIGNREFHRVLWYRRTFDVLPDSGAGLLLHFGAVDYSAHVWVNGQLVAAHEGGHTPFTADVTEAIRHDAGEQVVVVRAEDDPEDLEQPRGKQDWELHPHGIWYDRTSGIWQPVWLEPVPMTRISGLRWTPDVDQAMIRIEARLTRQDERALRLQVLLTQHGELLADDVVTVVGNRVLRDIPLAQADMTLGRHRVLWSPEEPNLIEATLRLLDEGGLVDEVESYAAMRSISASERRVLLNGRPYFLRLVLNQGFWPDTHLAVPEAAALRREVEQVRELGFNGVRLHQKVADPRFLFWCDRIGLLVWAEMPAAYEFSPRMVERVTREWLEVVRRDYSHPCIVAWVPFNESWGVPSLGSSPEHRHLVRALYHLTKALDGTRLVVGNDGWEQVVSDVITVHDYSARAAVLRERYGDEKALEETMERIQPGYRSVLLPGVTWSGEPVVVSEFGGIGYAPNDHDLWHRYGAVETADQLLERYRELVDVLLDSAAIAGFCYTQLTDVQQEKNGLLTERREPKVDPAAVRYITRRPAAAVPGDAIGAIEYGDHMPAVREPRADEPRERL
jgi:beta-galactosidase/beta-glucuronidase